MKAIEWTTEMDAVLREKRGQLTDRQIGQIVGASKTAVFRRAKYLGMPSRKDDYAWTNKEIERLKTLWAAGCAASLIGDEFQRTRGSILGMVFRLKLEPRRTAIQAKHRRRTIYPKQPREWVRVIDISPKPPLNIPFMDIKDGQCRQIVGHDGLALFCGHKTYDGTSWCPHHASINFNPASDRRPQHSVSIAAQIRRNELLAAQEIPCSR